MRPGQVATVRVRTSSVGQEPAANTRTCVRVPNGFALVRVAKGAVIEGRRVCWKLGELKKGQARKRWIRVRAIRPTRGRVNFDATANARGAGTGVKTKADGITRTRVEKDKPRKPEPVTG